MASEPKAGEVQRRDDGCYVYVGAFPMREWVRCSTPAALSLSAELSAAREMRDVLRAVEWPGDVHTYAACPCCRGLQPGQLPEGDEFVEFRSHYHEGHAPDCRLARLIGGDSP